MRFHVFRVFAAGWLAFAAGVPARGGGLTPEQIRQLPPPADHRVDFGREIQPLLEQSCLQCHGRGRDKGGFRLDSRTTLLRGGDSGAAVVPGDSAASPLIALVQGFDPDSVMPKKGTRLTPVQIGLLRAWIDQGLTWDANVTLGRTEPKNLLPHEPVLPPGESTDNPLDRLLAPYFAARQFHPSAPVSDRVFARRVYLDVIGMLPPPAELDRFEADSAPDKRARLVRTLLADNAAYAQHWLTFWNDALRNDYRGTGYIDGGREQITGWLYSALATNMTFDRFVADLVDPPPGATGFTKGIVWRGVVNASQTPEMQAAQNISQVFMGVNLKCASCHDSFINDLTLADAYGLAGIYAGHTLEMVQCDKPTGKQAELRFLYPELGALDAGADKTARLRRLAQVITGPRDARLTRTIVNRLWQRFLGRGLVEPVDEMEKAPWNADVLDWLAADLTARHYDLKETIFRILTSRAYQLPAVSWREQDGADYVFRGPLVRRLTAEQFCDAVSSVTGVWPNQSAAQINFNLGRSNAPAASQFPAQWVWSRTNAIQAAPPGTVYFRKTFTLPQLPTVAFALATADNSYTLYVNGHKAGAGNTHTQIDALNLQSLLVAGENTIAVSAVNGGDGPNPAGLFVYLYLRRESPGAPPEVLDLGTDASWSQTEAKFRNWEKSAPATTGTNWHPVVVQGPMGSGPWPLTAQFESALATPAEMGRIRASLVNADPLMVALGRPNREQVVTTRPSAATTLQALELTNGQELAGRLKAGAEKILAEPAAPEALVARVYTRALGRPPGLAELPLALDLLGRPVQPAGVEDLLWAVTMLPEFQLIY